MTLPTRGRVRVAEPERPVRVGRDQAIHAWLIGVADDRIDEGPVVCDDSERLYACTPAMFVPLDAANARHAIGVELTDRDATFLRD
jgi:hypothetical protein